MILKPNCHHTTSLIRHYIFLITFLLLTFWTNAQPITVTNSNSVDGGYPTLADAFFAINSFDQAGAGITITITGNSTEPAYGAILNGGNWVSVSILTTGSYAITGDVTTALIQLNGADHVTIDGRINQSGANELQFINLNTGTTASTLLFSNSARNNQISYCSIKGGSANANGGVVCFSASASSPGNDGNILSNNTISGLTVTDRPVNAIYSLATTAIDNSGNVVNGNSIFDFLNPGSASNGIHLSTGSASWTISGNSFYETTDLSPIANVEYSAIRINNTSGNGFLVENNFIGGSSASGNGLWVKTGSANNLFYGIYLNVGNSSNGNQVQGNNLRHFDWTNSLNANWTGIHIQSGIVNIGTVSGNTIGSGSETGNIILTLGTSSTTTDPSGFFGINYASSTAGTIQNNTIGAITTGNANPAFSCNFFGIAKIANFTSTPLIISNNLIGSLSQNPGIIAGSLSQDSIQVVYGIFHQIRNTYPGSATITNNTISGLANNTTHINPTDLAPGGQVHGIHAYLVSQTITGNTISNLTTSARNTNGGLFASVIGIMARFSATNQQISGNTIYNLSNTSTARARVIGIYIHGSQNLNNRVSENFIHNLSVSTVTSGAPFGEIFGIRVNYGAATYSNNIISLGTDVSSSSYIYGINDPGTSGNNMNLYHNSIYIAGVSNQAGCNSYAFFSSNNQNLKNIRNNIFHNERTYTSGSTYHCAVHYQLNSNGVTADDYNNYYISPTGYTARIGPPTPIIVVASFSDWQVYFGQDVHSNNDNSNFLNTSGNFSLPEDFTPGNPMNGISGTGISTDFSGTPRNCTYSAGAFENILPVGIPETISISAGIEPSCQTLGTETTTYSTSALNSTGFNWSLSNALAGTISPTTGEMVWASGFAGNVYIQVTANGCNGPSAMTFHTVNISPTVETPSAISISAGTEPTCQTLGAETTAYSTSAANSTGFNWSLSNALAGNINPTTGEMVWASGFAGNVYIQVTANGCNGPSAMTFHTVNISPTVETPSAISISAGTEPTCQTLGAETTAYSTSAANSTGFNWSLSNALAGNINPTTGEMIWASGFSGIVDIQVTADGCNGPSAMTFHTVNISPTVETPSAISISEGIEPTCQTLGAETTTYSTSALYSIGFNWSVSNALAGNINPTTGEMIWASGFSGNVDIQVTANGCNGPSAMTIHTVNISPTVETPSAISISEGIEPTCQTLGAETTAYSTSAANSTGFNWSLSNALAGIINPTTGEMIWASGFSGNVDIQVTANGCNGPSAMTFHTVNISPTVETPSAISISAGIEPSCQTLGTETTTYSTTAANSSGFNWSLSNALAGNINPTTGEMIWTSGYSGILDIQVTADGCNGPSAMTFHTVNISPTVETPSAISIFAGIEPICQTLSTETTTYSTTATNSTGFNWSVSNELAGTINPTTGEIIWASGFAGSVDIQVTANGCNGPSAMAIRTVNITPTVETPSTISISAGTEPTCQTLGTETTAYSTTAANSTGFNWSLSNALAGNINPTTGEMIWASGFAGSVDIQVTAIGCNGPSAMTIRSVNITPTVEAPSAISISAGTEPTCQTLGAETTAYSTTAANSTSFNWSVSNALAGNINPTTGEMVWASGFSGSVDIQVTANGCNGPSAMVVRQVIIHANPEPGILSTANNVCEGAQGNVYTTEPLMSGYNWILSSGGSIESGNGTNVLTVAWNTAGDQTVSVSYTNENGCIATDPAIYSVTVNAVLPVGVTIEVSVNPVVEGSPVTLTATAENGGSNPVYQWEVNGTDAGTNDPIFNYIPADGDLVTCELTSDANCITGNPAVSNQIEVTTITARTLNLHLFLEGLYIGGGNMRQASGESEPAYPAGIADQVSIELRDPYTGTVVYEFSNVNLTTTGNLTANIPAIHNGSYYIYVRHRNSIATASANPVSFSEGTVAFDFSSAPSQAYGSNLQNMGGVYALYGGDVNQDETIDTGDMTPVDNDSANYGFGYLVTDVNGDGIVDTGDMTIVDNNAANYVTAVLPF